MADDKTLDVVYLDVEVRKAATFQAELQKIAEEGGRAFTSPKKAVSELDKSIQELVTRTNIVRKEFQAGAKDGNQFESEMIQLKNAMMEVYKAETLTTTQLNKLTGGMRTAQASLDVYQGKITKLGLAHNVQLATQQRIISGLSTMGIAGNTAASGLGIAATAMGGLSVGATAGIAAIAGLGIAYGKLEKRGTDLNRQIERDNVILRQSADNFEEIAQKIDSFGAGFEAIAAQYNKADITRGVTELVKAGREASETFNILEVATKVASIENENLNDVALGTSQVLRQFKLDVEDAGKAGDVLTRGSLEAQGSITGLITGLSVVGPVAELAGLSLEETVAALVQLDQKGQDYADIGATALRSAISQLLDPSKEAQGVLTALGITAESGRDKFLQLTDAMASGEISAEQLAVIFDTRAVTAIANLDSNVFDLIGTMQSAGGELDTLANEMADTLEAAELRAKTAWDNVGVAISEGTLGMRTDMNEWSANVATNVEKAIRKMNEWGAVFEKWRNQNLANGGLFGLFPQLAGSDGGGGRDGGVGLTLGNESTVGNNPNATSFSTNEITLAEIQNLISQLEQQRKSLSANSPELANLNSRIAALREQANAFYPTRNPTGGTGLGGSGSTRQIRTVTGELSDYNKQLALNANLLTETARIEADLKTNKSFLTDLLNPDVQGSRGGLVAQIEAEIASLEARKDALKDTEQAQKDYEQSMKRLTGVYDKYNEQQAQIRSDFSRGNLDQNQLDDANLRIVQSTIDELESFARAGLLTDYGKTFLQSLLDGEQVLKRITNEIDLKITPQVNVAGSVKIPRPEVSGASPSVAIPVPQVNSDVTGLADVASGVIYTLTDEGLRIKRSFSDVAASADVTVEPLVQLRDAVDVSILPFVNLAQEVDVVTGILKETRGQFTFDRPLSSVAAPVGVVPNVSANVAGSIAIPIPEIMIDVPEQFYQSSIDAADRFATTVVSSASAFVLDIGQAIKGGEFIQGLQGALGLGQNLAGAANFGTLPFLGGTIGIGSLVGTGLGLLSGIFGLFGGDNGQKERERLASQNRSLPSITFSNYITQNNQYTGTPLDEPVRQQYTSNAAELGETMFNYVLPELAKLKAKVN